MKNGKKNRQSWWILCVNYLSIKSFCLHSSIAKLDTYDCEKSSFHDYLSNRKRTVKVNDKYCSWSKILFGVSKWFSFRTFTFQYFQMFYFLQDFDFAIMRTNLHHIVWVKVPNLLSEIKNNHQQFSLNNNN